MHRTHGYMRVSATEDFTGGDHYSFAYDCAKKRCRALSSLNFDFSKNKKKKKKLFTAKALILFFFYNSLSARQTKLRLDRKKKKSRDYGGRETNATRARAKCA